MSHVRPQPAPPVYQSNLWWCWAACLEMLNRAHPEKYGTPVRTQSDWVNAMRASPARSRLLNGHDGLNVHYLPQVLNALGMQGHHWRGGAAGAPVDLAFIEQKLHLGYLWGVYPVQGGSHFVVIYGVDNGPILRYFNPYPGRGYTTANQAVVQQTPLIIAWKI